MRRIETEDWWEDLVGLKDALSLRELSDRFNVTPGAISNALRRNHLVRKAAPSGPRAYRSIVTESEEPLPPEPGEKPSNGLQLVRPGSKDYLLQPAFHLLGKIPDADVAARCGVSVRTVASYRARHRIPGYTGPRKKPIKKHVHQSKIAPFTDLLGTEPDSRIAKRAGVTLNAVRHYRLARGIGASPASAVRAIKPPSEIEYAWLVRFVTDGDEMERVVRGTSLVQVAAAAAGCGLGEVHSITRVGELIDL